MVSAMSNWGTRGQYSQCCKDIYVCRRPRRCMSKIVKGETTVPFHSIRQSRVTDPSKTPKCHGGHGAFWPSAEIIWGFKKKNPQKDFKKRKKIAQCAEKKSI